MDLSPNLVVKVELHAELNVALVGDGDYQTTIKVEDNEGVSELPPMGIEVKGEQASRSLRARKKKKKLDKSAIHAHDNAEHPEGLLAGELAGEPRAVQTRKRRTRQSGWSSGKSQPTRPEAAPAQSGHAAVKGGLCRHQGGCPRHASFGYDRKERPQFCAVHKLEGMWIVTHPTCRHPGCTLWPSFGRKDDRRASFCGKHKTEGMTNISHPRCRHAGCVTQPSFGYEGDRRSGYCSRHKLEGMVNLRSSRCEQPGCARQPLYGNQHDPRPSYCSSHKLEGMTNVVSPRCVHPDCTRRPSFGKPGTRKAQYCARHKPESMVNVRMPLCRQHGCSLEPSWKCTEGRSEGQSYCAEHKLDGMVPLVRRTKPTQQQ